MDVRADTATDVASEIAKPATKIDMNTDTNIYLTTLQAAYEPQKEFYSRPNAVMVLSRLLQRYIDRQAEPVLYVFSRQLSHVAFIKRVQEILKTAKSDGVVQVMKASNDIKDMTVGGDLFNMLTTFLNIFPEYLQYIDHPDIRASAGQDFWGNTTRDLIKNFMALHRSGLNSNNHEQLERIAALVPEDMASEFADFLLEQLNVTDRPEASRSGLYKGWVCVALSTLAKKLTENPSKKKAISEILFKTHLPGASSDFSNIGLCLALSSLSHDEDTLKTTADNLQRYVANQLSHFQDQFNSKTLSVSLNMPKAFVALHQLEKYYASHLTRSSIIRLLISPENIYPFRTGIAELHPWILQPELKAELQSFFKRLLDHDNFTALVPLFWSWASKTNEASILNEEFFSELSVATSSLKIPSSTNTRFRENLMFLQIDSPQYVTPKDQHTIAENLIKVLDKNSTLELSAKNRIEIHTMMPSLQSWFTAKSLKTAMQGIKYSMYNHPEHNKLARISGAKALFALAQGSDQLTPADFKSFRDELLNDLANDAEIRIEAAAALQEYAHSAHVNQLPDLLMCLRSIPSNNIPAKLLMADVHDTYLAKMSPLQMQAVSGSTNKENMKPGVK